VGAAVAGNNGLTTLNTAQQSGNPIAWHVVSGSPAGHWTARGTSALIIGAISVSVAGTNAIQVTFGLYQTTGVSTSVILGPPIVVEGEPASAPIAAATMAWLVTGLKPGTNYDFFVQASCTGQTITIAANQAGLSIIGLP
jgi:hypothetical protein